MSGPEKWSNLDRRGSVSVALLAPRKRGSRADSGSSGIDDRETAKRESSAGINAKDLRAMCIESEDHSRQGAQAENSIKRVALAIRILGVTAIDSVAQSFTADIILVASWFDHTLIGRADLGDCGAIWQPRINIKNALGDMETVLDGSTSTSLADPSTGLVNQILRFRGPFYQYMHLHQFPFDEQRLTFVVSTPLPEYEMCFQRTEQSKIRMPALLLPEWDFGLPSCAVVTTDPNESTSHTVYSELQIAIPASRQSLFYMWNIVLVMLMICSLCLIVFCLPVTDLSNRLQVTLTLLLTAVAFKFVVSDSLPRVSYLTILDKYLLLCFAFLYTVTLECGLVTLLDNETMVLVDRCFALGAIVLLLIWHLFIFMYVRSVLRDRAQKKSRTEHEGTAL